MTHISRFNESVSHLKRDYSREDKHLHSNLLPVSTSEQEPPGEKRSAKEKLKGAICQMHPEPDTREKDSNAGSKVSPVTTMAHSEQLNAGFG